VTAEEVARGVDLSNRTVIVTGMHAHFSRSRSLSVSLCLGAFASEEMADIGW
jgi:hypothetical protein